MGLVYRGRGQELGGRAMQSAIGGDSWCTGKTPNYKRWGWDRSSDVRMLFEDDPASPSHPLHMETSNKQGACVLKIKCRICHNLIS